MHCAFDGQHCSLWLRDAGYQMTATLARHTVGRKGQVRRHTLFETMHIPRIEMEHIGNDLIAGLDIVDARLGHGYQLKGNSFGCALYAPDETLLIHWKTIVRDRNAVDANGLLRLIEYCAHTNVPAPDAHSLAQQLLVLSTTKPITTDADATVR